MTKIIMTMQQTGRLALVTGADGFIGSHLTEALLAHGYRVRALAQYNSFNNWGWLEDVGNRPGLEVVCGDVRDPEFCRSLCRGVDTVFHLAALIAIPYSYEAPDSYVDTQCSRYAQYASCGAQRGRGAHNSNFDERGVRHCSTCLSTNATSRQPQSPYSATKIAADALAESFYRAF